MHAKTSQFLKYKESLIKVSERSGKNLTLVGAKAQNLIESLRQAPPHQNILPQHHSPNNCTIEDNESQIKSVGYAPLQQLGDKILAHFDLASALNDHAKCNVPKMLNVSSTGEKNHQTYCSFLYSNTLVGQTSFSVRGKHCVQNVYKSL